MASYPNGCREDSFGPRVRGCSRFDFTLLFEDTILSLLPSCCFCVVGLFRWRVLITRSICVASCNQQWLKLCALLAYSALQFAVLIVMVLDSQVRNASSIAAFTLSGVCSILLCILSFLEHTRNRRPSTILILFLSLTALLDAVKVRTYWFIVPGSTLTILFTTSTIAKGLAFCLEMTTKSRHGLPMSDKKSPEETCGVIGLCLSLWLGGVLRRGLHWQITLDDLYDLGSAMSAEHLETSFMQQWERVRSAQNNQHALLLSCARVLKWPLLGVIPLRFLLLAFTLLQPLLLESLLTYLKEVDAPRDIGHGLIGAYVFVYLGIAISMNIYWYYHLRTIAKLRSVLVTALSKHTTAVNIQLLEDPKSPVTLMSNDVERAVQGIRYLHELWANAVQAGVAVYILERQARVACVVPVAITVATSIIVGRVTSAIGGKQIGWMEAIQKRIAATSGLLVSMKGIKMKGLEDRFCGIIEGLRSEDIACGNGFRKIIAYAGVFSFIPEFLCPFFTLMVLVAAPKLTGSDFDATKIFTILAALLVLTQPLANGFQILPSVLAGFASLSRIGAYLLTEEQGEIRQFDPMSRSSYIMEYSEKVLQDTGKRQASGLEVGKDGLSSTTQPNLPVFRIESGSFSWGMKTNTISGMNISIPRGTLTTIIGPVGSGKTTLCETLLGQTRKTSGNIYARVESQEIGYCSQIPHLSNASVKENIVANSPYDSKWYLTVMKAVGLWEEVLAMPKRDETVIGSNGSKLSGGQRQRLSIARAVYSRNRTVILDDVFSGLDKTNARNIFSNLLGPEGLLRQSTTTVILVTHSPNYLAASGHIIALSSAGSVVADCSYDEFVLMPGYKDFAASVVNESSYESASQGPYEEDEAPKKPEPEDPMRRARQSSEWKIYKFYAKAVGPLQLFLLAFVSVAAAVFWNYSTIWLKRWADNTTHFGGNRNGYFLGIYTMFQCLTIIFLFGVAMHSLTNVAAQSGRSLHTVLLRTLLAAPLSVITSTDSGQIINRFSQDIQLVDSELPMALMNFVLCIATGIGQGIVIIVVSPWTGLAFPPLLLLLYGVQKLYLRTSKQIRVLDLEAKSPLYAHFLDTVSGLSTIRAFGWTQRAQMNLHQFLDSSQKPYYILFMIQQWLSLCLDMIIAIVAIVVVAVAVSLDSQTSSIGVALIQVMSFAGILRQSIVSWTQMETSIAAVTRIKDFNDKTESEHNTQHHNEPPAGWPSQGKVEFRNASAVYQSHPDTLVLRNIDLATLPGEKIGLCGRSGSGKSSLVLSLFRMTRLLAGSVVIDGIDLSTLPLSTIRLRLNAVPQDACFVPGSIRLNLQPPGTVALSDEKLTNVLCKVKLWDIIEEHGGLDAELNDSIFSHGQKQLFGLASSLLRPSKVVVLDEFTSSVDTETDVLMQQLIQEHFSSATVISIAHRLDTIMSCSRVMMMDRGSVVDCGAPKDLLALGKDVSAFARFVDENIAVDADAED